MKKTKKHQLKISQRKELIRIAEYLISGGAWFWSGYFIIVFMTPVIGLWWANLLGNGVGLTINFLLERNWVFTASKKRKTTDVTSRYIVYTGFNFLINYLILLGLQKVGITVAIGQFIAAGFFTFWNYVWYKLWVFKGAEAPRKTRHHV
jgi:putative flippase GtrA